MKKTLAMLLALVMLFGLAACNGKTDAGGTSNPGTSTPGTSAPNTDAPSTPEPADTTPELTGEPIKIGHIADLTGTEALTGAEAQALPGICCGAAQRHCGPSCGDHHP